MSPPSNPNLNDVRKANEDLEQVLKRHRELTDKLEKIRKRYDALLKEDIATSKMDRSPLIMGLLKKRQYDKAEKELNRFLKDVQRTEDSKENILGFNKRFQTSKNRWYDLINKGKLRDDGSLVKVAEAANSSNFDEASIQLDRMDRIMEEADGHGSLKLKTKGNYDHLMELAKKLEDEDILPERDIVENQRIRKLIKDGNMGEGNDLIKKKIILLQELKKDQDTSNELYYKLAKQIDDFNDIGYMEVPQEFKNGLREFETKNYSKAVSLFKQAEIGIEKMIEEAKPIVNYKLDMRGTKIFKDRWEEGNLIIKNEGVLDVTNLEIEASSDNYKLDLDGEGLELKTGKEAKVPIRVYFNEEGLVPIRMRMEVTSLDGRKKGERKKKFRIEVASHLPKTTVDLTKSTPTGSQDTLRKKVGEVYKVKEEQEIDLKEGDFYSYRIRSKLGAGGFSTVYRVTAGETEYAMKTPKDIGIEGDETVEINKREMLKFKKEASIWAMLTDTVPEDVVRLIDVGLEPFPWFVMELADGSLRDHLEGASLDKRIDTAMEVLTKFDRIHHLGIVHRDIKPENILFIDDSAKITDFGISKLVSSTSKSTVGTSGTCFYMSPEQISKSRFGAVDWRTDIWQLGILTYEILTDRLPFEAEDPYEVTSNILHDEPVPISNFNDDLRELDATLLRALHKDKKKRYQSAIELRFYLEKALED